MNKKKKLYIGCALMGIQKAERDELLANIEKLKKGLSKKFEILDFLWVKVKDPSKCTPAEVYDYDINKCVKEADCMLAICDYPSTGMGYEIATAIEKYGKPVLAVAHKDSVVTKLIRGIDHKNFKFYYYNSFDEVLKKTLEIL